jgi:CRISPR-associated endonuclease/helicase Cas3
VRLLAHSADPSGKQQAIRDHLLATAEVAAQEADRWQAADWGRLAGLLHDVGKVSEKFQRYVRGIGERGGDHSLLGAVLAAEHAPLAFAIAGHHTGLSNLAELRARLADRLPDRDELVSRAATEVELPERTSFPPLPEYAASDNTEAELFTRMLFSALVDADYLDTEAHFRPDQADTRGSKIDLVDLWPVFEQHQAEMIAGAPDTHLNRIRRGIYERCLAAAHDPQGFRSLTVPTGGGKTLSAIGFALRHALCHGLDRVIVVIPYTSIIEQTAGVYRDIFGPEAVLEHHSAVSFNEEEDTDRLRWQLAAENCDAPIVVTTAVQFFESLFSNRPSRCRKLHRIARSVVIIDEVQTLPIGLLRPSLAMLASLVRNYRVTALLTTATPPAYDHIIDDPITEIIHDPVALAEDLRRVTYSLPPDGRPPTMDWHDVANVMAGNNQAMTVVNSRKDARALFAELPEASRVHLSTNMCAAHRREVLDEVRRRLSMGEPIHLATTQLVEAGVDIDFPLVLRALAPLDRIVQAAGRCNREGKLDTGRVIVFDPVDGAMPPGIYQTAAHTTNVVFADEPQVDLNSPSTHRSFFELLYPIANLDEHDIAGLRSRLAFEQIAHKYRLIPDATIPVAVPWGDGERLLDEIEARGELTRFDLRALQPYIVSMQPWEHARAEADRLCRRLIDGIDLWRWEGGYDSELGIVVDVSATRIVT